MNATVIGRLAAVVLVVTGCATQTGTAAAPEVTLVQQSAVPNARVEAASGVPVQFQLQISNPLDHAVTLVSVEIESVGQSGAYELKRVRHLFDRVISARSTDAIALRAWVQPLQADVRGTVGGPVMLRGSARFESEAGVLRRNFVGRGQ